MKKFLLILSTVLIGSNLGFSQTKTIHVFVALCDNVHQGIVPVPASIGDGKSPRTNLYWGAGYGVKSFFKNKTDDWVFVKSIASQNTMILERILFKHANEEIYMLADAYDGEQIKGCIEDFLKTSNGQHPLSINHDEKTLNFGGNSNMVAYIGHDGLMEFDVDINYNTPPTIKKDVIIIACYSKSYFTQEIEEAGANPILWTTHLMAPEAYTLKSALDGWILNENGASIDERAAQTYNTYQKCGLKGARNLFTTGF